MPLSSRKIVVIVSGGIAAYKSADLVSRLRKAGAAGARGDDRAPRASSSPPSPSKPSAAIPFMRKSSSGPPSWEMEHISWARWADAVVVAPATANLLAKMALGLADDAASTLLLAYQGPVWVAPAMNTAMLDPPGHRAEPGHAARARRALHRAGRGRLACGEVGAGPHGRAGGDRRRPSPRR